MAAVGIGYTRTPGRHVHLTANSKWGIDMQQYNRGRFSVTMIVNMGVDDPEGADYSPASTVEVDAADLFDNQSLDNTTHKLVLAAFDNLAEKWKRRVGYIPPKT